MRTPVDPLPRTVAYHATVVAIGFSALLASCAGPGLHAGFDAPDPAARLHATVQAAAENDTTKLPQIVEDLDSDDSAVRMLSIYALERLTGETLGYNFAAPKPDRQAAVEAWRRKVGAAASDRAAVAPASSVGSSSVGGGAER